MEADCLSPASPDQGTSSNSSGCSDWGLAAGWHEWSAACELTIGPTADPRQLKEFQAIPHWLAVEKVFRVGVRSPH
jgi:hypothetical protein